MAVVEKPHKPIESKIVEEFLKTVRKEMERQGITAYQLSKLTGLGRSNVYRIINGDNVPSLENADLIASALGLRMTVTK